MRVGGIYEVQRNIGKGSFGAVYLAQDTMCGDRYACKLETITPNQKPQLDLEFRIYRHFASYKAVGIPQAYWFGLCDNHRALIMDLLGLNLQQLLTYCGGTFTLKTTLMLAVQMLERVELIHTHSICHRDIKPENFVMGRGHQRYVCHLIDFGLCKKFLNSLGRHVECKQYRSMVGTARYTSMNATEGLEHSRRDDLIALGYVWIYFLKGTLPWQGIQAKTTSMRNSQIAEIKRNTPIACLCEGCPSEIAEYMEAVTQLAFDQPPDYKALKALLKGCAARHDIVYDGQYDWILQKRSLRDTKKEGQVAAP